MFKRKKKMNENNNVDANYSSEQNSYVEEDVVEENGSSQESIVEDVKKVTGVKVRKVIALVLLFVFAFTFAAGSAGTGFVLASGADIKEALRHEPYFNLYSSQQYIQSRANTMISQVISESLYWVNGTYDGKQTIDITNLSGGILTSNKNPATTYKMEELVLMYENSLDSILSDIVGLSEEVSGDYPDIIQLLQESYGVDQYYVDNAGNLYALMTNEDTWSLDDYLNALPVSDISNFEPLERFGCMLYQVTGDVVEDCYALPEEFETIERIGWSEFAARNMIDVSEAGLSARELQNFDYAEYGTRFQYLYKHGIEVETVLPESGEPLAVYALKNPADVSILDLYKQLAAAIKDVGSAVANAEFDQILSTSDITEYEDIYFWVKDLSTGTIWTNNSHWEDLDMDGVQKEIRDYSTTNNGLDYPYYIGTEIYMGEDMAYESNELFSSVNNSVYSSDTPAVLAYDYGIAHSQCVVAVNPQIRTAKWDSGLYVNIYRYLGTYEKYVPRLECYLLMTAAGGIGMIICGIVSLVMAGRRDRSKKRYAGPFAKNVPIELLLLLDVGCWIAFGVYFILMFIDNAICWNYGLLRSDYIVVVATIMVCIALATWQILTLVCKGKSRNMRTNSLIGRAGNGLAKGCKTSAFTRKCPIELMLLIFLVVWIIFAAIMSWACMNTYTGLSDLICLAIIFAGIVILAYWQIATLVYKAKSKNMTTNSLVKRFGGAIAGGCKSFYKHRKVTGKLFLCSIIFCVVSLIFVGLSFATGATGLWIFLLIVLWIVTIVLLMKKCMQKQRLKDGIHEIAGGNLDYQIQMEKLTGDELDMACDMNNIREGMESAVERMLKSERMKTDLITNVSHDLKTPLTSIINYVDILKKEDIQDPKIRGYIDILEQKSARLKNLTEDLMEAAKISSGNITLELQNINLKQLLYQTNGEFEEKFARRNLQLVCTLPDSDVFINADGRRMWRVIENLYNNAAKYAQPYSRVYVDGKLQAGKVELIIKNVSEAPLNISADELMERFVRGDVARNTEGSGLGLEIARNLTVMQKGTFDIQLDGDLFKVILTFDAV